MAYAAQNGARLSYVVVPLPNEVIRDVVVMEERTIGKYKDGTPRVMHEMKRKGAKQPGGFMVYFPRGHAVRIRNEKDLKQFNLDRKPTIINLEGLNDPNSPLGRLMLEQDEAGRAGAYLDMEKAVIALATRKSGTTLMPEQIAKVK